MKTNLRKNNAVHGLASLSLVLALLLCSCGTGGGTTGVQEPETTASVTEAVEHATRVPEETDADGLEPSETDAVSTEETAVDADSWFDSVPKYSGSPYVEVNDNEPFFSEADRTRTDPFEEYSGLDSLGRCGVAYANVCRELMPTEERGSIGRVKPSGWHTVKYNGYVDGNYLYNRCHLIGYQLAGENANEQNLITGTRYMNMEGQLPLEDMVDDYVDETDNHVLYRVTPVFEGDNLLASGVLMEAYSVEDEGTGLVFCVYCYNVQPGIGIDYATGDSWLLNGYDGTYAVNGEKGGNG